MHMKSLGRTYLAHWKGRILKKGRFRDLLPTDKCSCQMLEGFEDLSCAFQDLYTLNRLDLGGNVHPCVLLVVSYHCILLVCNQIGLNL